MPRPRERELVQQRAELRGAFLLLTARIAGIGKDVAAARCKPGRLLLRQASCPAKPGDLAEAAPDGGGGLDAEPVQPSQRGALPGGIVGWPPARLRRAGIPAGQQQGDTAGGAVGDEDARPGHQLANGEIWQQHDGLVGQPGELSLPARHDGHPGRPSIAGLACQLAGKIMELRVRQVGRRLSDLGQSHCQACPAGCLQEVREGSRRRPLHRRRGSGRPGVRARRADSARPARTGSAYPVVAGARGGLAAEHDVDVGAARVHCADSGDPAARWPWGRLAHQSQGGVLALQ